MIESRDWLSTLVAVPLSAAAASQRFAEHQQGPHREPVWLGGRLATGHRCIDLLLLLLLLLPLWVALTLLLQTATALLLLLLTSAAAVLLATTGVQ